MNYSATRLHNSKQFWPKPFILLMLFTATVLLSIFYDKVWALAESLDGTSIYYVSETGNDAASGDLSNPWKTLNKAESFANDGDTIKILSGTYLVGDGTTQLTLAKSLKWIGDDQTIIKSAGGTAPIISLTGSKVISFENLIFDGQSINSSDISLPGNVSNKSFSNCTFNGATTYTIRGGSGTSISFDKSNFLGTPTTAIQFDDPNATISNSTFEVGAKTILINLKSTTGSGKLTITGSTIKTNAKYGFVVNGDQSIELTNSTVEADQASSSDKTYLFNFKSTAGNNKLSVTGSTIRTNATYGIELDGNQSIELKNSNIEYRQSGNAYALVNAYLSEKSGTYNVVNNTITNTATSASALINIAGPSSQKEIMITRNRILQNNPDQKSQVIRAAGKSVEIKNNQIENLSTLSASPIVVSSNQVATNATITGNNIRTKNMTGYIIGVGTESTSANDNLITANISSNTILGPISFDQSLAPSVHSIFVGFNKNAKVYQNYIYGGGYGVVLKGGSAQDYGNRSGCFKNVIINNYFSDIYLKGVVNVPVYNNTILQEIGVRRALVAIGVNPDNNVIPIGSWVQANVLVSKSGNTMIALDDGGLTNSRFGSNIYSLTPPSNGQGIVFRTGVNSLSFEAWNSLTNDQKSLVTDPKFVREGGQLSYSLDSPVYDIDQPSLLASDFIGNCEHIGAEYKMSVEN